MEGGCGKRAGHGNLCALLSPSVSTIATVGPSSDQGLTVLAAVHTHVHAREPFPEELTKEKDKTDKGRGN